MKEPDKATAESGSVSLPAPMTPVACMELDRFCEECGYNLRTQPVCRDHRIGVLLVRCPECGRFQPANDGSTALRPWVRRATALLLVLWIGVILTGLACLFAGEIVLSIGTLEELTVSGGYQSVQVGSTTTYTWQGGLGPLEIKSDLQEYEPFIAAVLVGSILTGFTLGLFAVVVFPHWPRAAYVGLALATPVVAGLLVALSWSYEAPHLLTWGLQYVVAHAVLQVLGGLAGIIFGRPFARLLVRIILPSSLRPRLAFLWLADNKPLPRP